MPVINPTKDGKVILEGERTHLGAVGGSRGVASHTDSSATVAVGYLADRVRRTYSVYRSFFCFDTSGITSNVLEATFGVRGVTNGSADTIIMQSDAFGGDCGTDLSDFDFNNFNGNRLYSSQKTTWNTNTTYNDFDLNSDALSDIENRDSFIIALLEHDFDYGNIDGAGVSADVKNGLFYVEDASSKPKLTYTLGYKHEISGVTPLSMGNINGVETANIENISGV